MNWTAKEVRWLKDHYRALGVAACARHLGRPPHQIRTQARYVGLARQRHRPDWGRATQLYHGGYLDCEIARELGVTAGAVTNWRNRQGLARNRDDDYGAAAIKHRSRALLLDLWGEGFADDRIATALGVSTKAVANMRARMGLPNKNGPRWKGVPA